MAKLTYDEAIQSIKESYTENPTETERMLNNFAKELEYAVKHKDVPKKHKKNDTSTFILVVEFICIFIACINGVESLPMALFGLIFFAAGICIGLFIKGPGIIFLFSHGMVGLGVMLGGILGNMNETVLSDISSKSKTYLTLVAVFGIVIVLANVFYNLNDDLKENPYNKNIIVGLYLLLIIILRIVLSYTGIVPFQFL